MSGLILDQFLSNLRYVFYSQSMCLENVTKSFQFLPFNGRRTRSSSKSSLNNNFPHILVTSYIVLLLCYREWMPLRDFRCLLWFILMSLIDYHYKVGVKQHCCKTVTKDPSQIRNNSRNHNKYQGESNIFPGFIQIYIHTIIFNSSKIKNKFGIQCVVSSFFLLEYDFLKPQKLSQNSSFRKFILLFFLNSFFNTFCVI